MSCSFEDEQDEYFGDDVFGRFRFGSFGPSSPFSDMHNAFRGAETMLRHVDKMFQNMQMYGEFGHILGPNDGHGIFRTNNVLEQRRIL